MVRWSNLDRPLVRPLKAFTFDPSLGKAGSMTVHVPFEELQPGPVSKMLRVLDYDASNDCYYPPVDLDTPEILIRGGLDPSESDPRFHQQMVYGVITETIDRFRFALGREPKWNREIHGPLLVLPHAKQDANAFYSRDLKALCFGYFPASDEDPGVNLPGQAVFTCLSHDIIAHETTHALIDGLKDHFMEQTSIDTPAFHEAFADIVALFQHFTYEEALVDVIRRSGGLIYRPELAPDAKPAPGGPFIEAERGRGNPLVELARQFGEAMGTRKALRSAIGKPVDPAALARLTEPHLRGAILVAAVFDAYFSIYVRRTRDLVMLARANGQSDEHDLHPDLAKRLAAEAKKTAQHFCNICIRALDYCPPVDVQFGDFLRAMITADYDLVRDDSYGYREALIQAFRARGIRPDNVRSFAEDSLRWSPPDTPLACTDLRFDLFNPPTRKEMEANAQCLWQFGNDRDKRGLLGLNPDVSLPVKVHTFRPVTRIGPDGKLKLQVVVELTQQMEKVPLDDKDPLSPSFTYRGGVTLVLDEAGRVLYSVHKPMGLGDAKDARLQRLRDYYSNLDRKLASSVYVNGAGRGAARPLSVLDGAHNGNLRMDFNLLHRGF